MHLLYVIVMDYFLQLLQLLLLQFFHATASLLLLFIFEFLPLLELVVKVGDNLLHAPLLNLLIVLLSALHVDFALFFL